MTRQEKYEKLLEEYEEVSEQVRELNKQKASLKYHLDNLYREMCPFVFNTGYYAETSKGIVCVYVNYANRTIYTKPLYNSIGRLGGRLVSAEMVEDAKVKWERKGYSLVG